MGKHEESFERWLRYEREVQLANTSHMTFDTLPELALCANPTITLPRETLLNLRASYVLLTNVVAELLDLKAETMTQLQVAGLVARRQLNGPEVKLAVAVDALRTIHTRRHEWSAPLMACLAYEALGRIDEKGGV